MSNIIFDLMATQPSNKSMYHGGGEYTKTIFLKFLPFCKYDKVYVCYDHLCYIDNKLEEAIANYNIEVIDTRSPEEVIGFLLSFPKREVTVFFAGMIYAYKNSEFPENVTSIGVCHGLRKIEKPKDRFSVFYSKRISDFLKYFIKGFVPEKILKGYYASQYKKNMNIFDKVYTVSYHSLYAFRALFPLNSVSSDIQVHYQTLKDYNRFDDEMSNKEHCFSEYINYDYILMLSADRWEKNSYRGICVLDQLVAEKKIEENLRFVVLGNYPYILRNIIRNSERFIFKKYVDAVELEYAYKNCRLLFYPTLNEGYGLPPMEAMKYGKTCVVSGICSLPEVYGDAVYYCSPYDYGEMKTRLLYALDVPIDQKKVIERVEKLKKIQEYSTMELLNSLNSYAMS